MSNAPLYQQDLERYNRDSSLKLCAPTALYELAVRKGYDMPAPCELARSLDWENAWDARVGGWRRNELCKMFRQEYGVQSATWWTKYTGLPQPKAQIEAMRAGGYIETQDEQAYLESIGFRLNVASLALRDSVVITVDSGFSQNKSAHAVVIEGYDENTGQYRVFDPDNRTSQLDYDKDHFEAYVSENGAVTAILDA